MLLYLNINKIKLYLVNSFFNFKLYELLTRLSLKFIMKKTIVRFHSVKTKHLGTFMKKYFPEKEEMYDKFSYEYDGPTVFHIHDKWVIKFCKVHLLPIVNKYEQKNLKDMIIMIFISTMFDDLYDYMYRQVSHIDRISYDRFTEKRSIVIDSLKQKVGLT